MEKLDSILFYNMDKAIRTYRNFGHRVIKAKGYTMTTDQWLIIKAVLENPEIAQNKIGELVFKDNASVTRIIEILVKQGLIIRNVDAKDRRKTKLKVTKSGIEMIEKLQSLIEVNRQIALQGISPKDLQIVNATLLKIAQNCNLSNLI